MVRYQARVGNVRSRSLRLDRRLQITGRRGATFSGRVVAPARVRPRTIRVVRQVSCNVRQPYKTVRLRRDGRFSVRVSPPRAGEQFAIYRVIARLRSYPLRGRPLRPQCNAARDERLP